MSKLANEYKRFMKDLEQNIENKEDYDHIKSEMSKLFMVFFSELDEMKEMYEKKIDAILERQRNFDEKISRIENSLNNIHKDIYLDESSDFEILCPYCNNEFVIELDEIKDEVQCPECKNTIELDWNDLDEECCDGECSHCQGHDCMDDYDEDDEM